MIEYKEYKDALHELKVKAISRTMAWLLIRWECQKLKIMAPASINNIIEVTSYIKPTLQKTYHGNHN